MSALFGSALWDGRLETGCVRYGIPQGVKIIVCPNVGNALADSLGHTNQLIGELNFHGICQSIAIITARKRETTLHPILEHCHNLKC